MTTEQTLPKGWEKTTLGEIATYVNGRAFKPKEWSKTGTPIVRIQNLNNPNAEYNYYDGDIEQKYHIKNGDLLFAWSASLGAYIWKGENAFLNQHIFKVLPKENIDKTFMYYLLDKVTDELYAKAHGSGMVHVTKGKFEATSVYIPPLETQQTIVNKIESLFAEIDAGIGSLKTAVQQLAQYRQSLLKNAFNGELTKAWREENADTLPTANELLAQIQTTREQHHAKQLADWQTAVSEWEQNGKEGKKPAKPKAPTQAVKFEEDFADLPNGWIWGKLSDLGELARGKSKHRPRNDKKLFGGKYPFIQTGEVRAANRIITKYEQTYSEFGLEQSKLWQKGTLCITIAANIAETAFLGFDACFPDSIVGFSASKAVLPEYIELFIKSAQTKIESYAPATAQKNINLNTLENLIVPYCSLAEQTQIVAILENKLTACDRLAADLAAQLKQAELLKQSVLKAAFSGKLLGK